MSVCMSVCMYAYMYEDEFECVGMYVCMYWRRYGEKYEVGGRGGGRTDIGALVLCALRQNLFLNIHRSRDRDTETHNIPTKSFD